MVVGHGATASIDTAALALGPASPVEPLLSPGSAGSFTRRGKGAGSQGDVRYERGPLGGGGSSGSGGKLAAAGMSYQSIATEVLGKEGDLELSRRDDFAKDKASKLADSAATVRGAEAAQSSGARKVVALSAIGEVPARYQTTATLPHLASNLSVEQAATGAAIGGVMRRIHTRRTNAASRPYRAPRKARGRPGGGGGQSRGATAIRRMNSDEALAARRRRRKRHKQRMWRGQECRS